MQVVITCIWRDVRIRDMSTKYCPNERFQMLFTRALEPFPKYGAKAIFGKNFWIHMMVLPATDMQEFLLNIHHTHTYRTACMLWLTCHCTYLPEYRWPFPGMLYFIWFKNEFNFTISKRNPSRIIYRIKIFFFKQNTPKIVLIECIMLLIFHVILIKRKKIFYCFP